VSADQFLHMSLPYYISVSLSDFEMDKVHEWLSVDAYWSKGVPREVLERAFQNSLVFGLFHKEEGQVGVARMTTDKATFAYLADVFILSSHRGTGLGRWLMEIIMAYPDLQGLRRIMLATSDMQALYRQFGFVDCPDNGKLMEIVRPDIYQN